MVKSLYFYLLFSVFSVMPLLGMESSSDYTKRILASTPNYAGLKRVANPVEKETLLPLHQSILENDIEAIEQRLESEESAFDFLNDTSCGGNALFFACGDQSGKIAELILTAKPDLAHESCFKSDTFALYPLQVAATQGNAKVAELLLNHGADIHAAEFNSLTPLDYAIRYNSKSPVPGLLELLVHHGAQMPHNEELQENWNAYEIANMFPCPDAKLQENVKKLLMGLKDPITDKNFLHMAVKNNRFDDVIHFFAKFPEQKEELDKKGHTPFHQACLEQNIPMLALLLKYGCDINSKNQTESSPLHSSCQQNIRSKSKDPFVLKLLRDKDNSVLQWLIDNKADLEAKNIIQMTPFLWAAQHANKEAMEALYKAGANIAATDNSGVTALHLTCFYNKKNCKETLEWLLTKNQIDINSRDLNGETPFLTAVNTNNLPALSILKNAGADVTAVDSGGNTALHIASLDPNKERLEILRWLLDNCNIPINSKDLDGNTALHMAAAKGNLETIQLLYHYGADIKIGNNLDESVLHMAVDSVVERVEKIEWLLTVCPELLEAADINKETPLVYAAYRSNIDALKILYNHGANIYANTTVTILHVFIYTGSKESLDWILSLPQNVIAPLINMKSSAKGLTPYMSALLNSNYYALEALYKVGADASLSYNGFTPLEIACYKKDTNAAQIVINHGADINHVDGRTQTPLIIAMAESNNFAAVELLCKHGVDLTATTTTLGENALEIAQRYGHGDIVAFLKPLFKVAKRKLNF